MKKLILTKKEDSSNIRYEYDSNNKLNKIIFIQDHGYTDESLYIENDTVVYQPGLYIRYVFDTYGVLLKMIREREYYGEYEECIYVKLPDNKIIGYLKHESVKDIHYHRLTKLEMNTVHQAIATYNTYGGDKLAKQILSREEYN